MSNVNVGKIGSYEFNYSLKINDNILIHRDFNIRKYNKNFRESLEYRDLVDELIGDFRSGKMGLITKVLKKASIEQCWETYNPNKVQSFEESLSRDDLGKSDEFLFEITQKNHNKRDIIFSCKFSGDPYQPKTRVKIDIKEELPEILETIRFYLSKNEYTKNYGTLKLERFNKLSKREINEYK